MKLLSAIIGLAFLFILPVIGNSQTSDLKEHEQITKSQGMPGSGANECFKESMMRAIDIQEMNMKNENRRSLQSDREMTDQMKRAQGCLQSMGVPGGSAKSRNDQMQCADDWLKQAMSLHEQHMNNPSSRTKESERNLSRQLREAFNCTGPSRSITGEKR